MTVSSPLCDEYSLCTSREVLSLTKTTLAILYTLQMRPDPFPPFFFTAPVVSFEAFMVICSPVFKPSSIRQHESTLGALNRTRLFLSSFPTNRHLIAL